MVSYTFSKVLSTGQSLTLFMRKSWADLFQTSLSVFLYIRDFHILGTSFESLTGPFPGISKNSEETYFIGIFCMYPPIHLEIRHVIFNHL